MTTIGDQVNRFAANEPVLDQVVNGSDATDVALLSGGTVPSLRKFFKTLFASPPPQWLVALAGAGLSYNAKGDPGAAGNVAVGRAQLKAVKATTGDVWFLSEGGRSGYFIAQAPGFVAPLDPNEGIYITAYGFVFKRIYYGPYLAGWFGALGDNSSDDTPVCQAILDFMGRNGGGTCLFDDNKRYILSGALQDTSASNSQLILPKINNYENLITIRFKGATPQLNAQGGSVFVSTLTGTDGGAVIGCKNPHNNSGYVQDNCTWVNFYFEDMTLECPQNPSLTGIDGTYFYNLHAPRSVITVTGGRTHSGVFPAVNFATPTVATSYALKCPVNDLSLKGDLTGFLAFGFYNGFKNGELMGGTDVIVSDCILAIDQPETRHPSYFGHILFLSCQKTFKYTGSNLGAEFNCEKFDIEHGGSPMGGLPYGYDIDDPNNLVRGTIKVHMHDAYPFTMNGGDGIVIESAGGPRFNIYKDFATLKSGPGTKEAYALPGYMPHFSAVGAQTATVDGVCGAFTASNRYSDKASAANNYNYRIGGIYFSTDGSLASGKAVFATSDDNGNINEWMRLNKFGDFQYQTGTHKTQTTANSDTSGNWTLNNAQTSGPLSFNRPFNNPPNVSISPNFDVGAGVRYWVTSTTKDFTINTSAPVTGTFSYQVNGAPN